ncbi:MAG: hypothetical protein GW903_09665 [Alphaproteobacteria bacterium]|nr:hypothetical protein [Alphaproteobacteria bacterium]NCQ89273.1 hypothetical protein [Alphaproteobacteria bacterium]NCT08136.1 hypothetical protein [Alphaproteobacteria bacterium]
MLNHFKKLKETIEISALDSMGYPYILFDGQGVFIRAHPAICDVFRAFNFGENEMRYPNSLIAALQSCEWQGGDALQHYYRNKMMSKASYDAEDIPFTGLIKYKKAIVYAHVQKMPFGSFAFFRDIHADYALNKASEIMCRSSRGIAGVLKAHKRRKPEVQDNRPLYSLAGNV